MKKAFTLIELMAVVIILGIITTITVTSINYSIKRSRDRLYVQQVKRLEEGVRKWAVKNTETLPVNETGIVFFSVSRLKDEGIVDTEEVKDPRTNQELKGCMTIRYDSDFQQYSYEYEDMDCAFVSNAYMPIINVAGGDLQYVEVNGVYTFPSATAQDYNGRSLRVTGPLIYDGDNIVTSIDKSVVGKSYTLEYKSTDDLLNLTQTRNITLTVNDTISPVITCGGRTTSHSVNFEADTVFTFPTCTVSDNSCGTTGVETNVNSCATTLTPNVTTNVVPNIPGTYTVEYSATDSSSNSRYLILTVNVVDTTAPSQPTVEYRLNSSSGAVYNGAWTRENVWIGNFSSTDVGTGVMKYQYAKGSSCDLPTPLWTDLPGGNNYMIINTTEDTQYCFSALDYANNRSTSSIVREVRVDKNNPTVTASNASSLWFVTRTSTITASDADSGLLEIRYQWNANGMNATCTTGGTVVPSGTTITVPTGSNRLYVCARDNAGNTQTYDSGAAMFNVEIINPVITVTNASSAWFSSRTTNISATDAGGSGLAQIRYQWNTNGMNAACTSGGTILTSGTNVTVPAGSNRLYVCARDNAGNVQIYDSGANMFRVDSTTPSAPTITVSESWTNAASVSGTIGGSTDAESGINRYEYSVNGGSTWSTGTSFTISTEGSTTVLARSVNGAGMNSTNSSRVVRIDRTAPTLPQITSGTMRYRDPSFVSGSNNMTVYNNSGGGTVTHSRMAMATPTGSGFGIRITTSGTASPGLGGFVQNTVSYANGVYAHVIIARIPVGYTIERASNATGNGATHTWITSKAGTGNWQEYIYITRAGADGTFSTFGHVYISGPAGTTSNPVTWDVAYATLIEAGYWGTTGNLIFQASDTASGITGYGINTSSTVQPTFTNVTNTNSLGINLSGYTTNNTYYIWVRDAAGNVRNNAVVLNTIDIGLPTLSASNASSSWFTSRTTAFTASDTQSGVAEIRYQWNTNGMNAACTTGGTTIASGTNITVPAGSNRLYGCARDNAGNVRTYDSGANMFRVDTTAPSVPTLDVIEWWNRQASVSGTIAGSTDAESGINRYEYSMSGATSLGWTSGSSFTVTNEGQTTVTVRAINGAGAASTTTSKVVRIDRTAPSVPTVNLNGYTSGNWTNGNVTITLSSTDTGGSAMWKYQYSHDNANWADWPTTLSNWTINWDGNWTFYARAVDWSGNVSGSSTSWIIRRDTVAPTVSNITNTSGGSWTNQNVTLGWSTADTGGSGLGQFQFSYDQVNINPTSIPQPTAGATSWSSSSVWSAERNNSVYFRVIDRAGNASAWSSATAVRIDKTAPTLSWSRNGSTTYSTSQCTTPTYSDGASGVASALYTWSSATSGVNPSYSMPSGSSRCYSTTHTTIRLHGRVCDNAGNCTQTYTGVFYVDATVPTWDSTAPTCVRYTVPASCSNTYLYRLTNLNNIASDAHSGLSSVRITFGGFTTTSISFGAWVPSNSYITTGGSLSRVWAQDAVGNTSGSGTTLTNVSCSNGGSRSVCAS